MLEACASSARLAHQRPSILNNADPCGVAVVDWHRTPELQSGNCFFNSEPRCVHYHQSLMVNEYAHVHKCMITSMECVRTPHTLMTHFSRNFETQVEMLHFCVSCHAPLHARRPSLRHVSHSKLLGTCPLVRCAHRPDNPTSPNGTAAELSVHAGNAFPCCTLREATTQVFYCLFLVRLGRLYPRNSQPAHKR